MTKAAYCIATSESQAREITRTLRESGFASDDISVLFPDKTGTRDFAEQQNTRAPEGTVAGVGTGGVVGGALGWMVGLGALAIPGAGPFIAAGPIVGMLAGMAVGATVGGVGGALIGMGIPESEARRYAGRITSGNILVSVHTDDAAQLEKAQSIFAAANAQDISSTNDTGSSAKAR